MAIEFGTWATPESVNPYIETVEAMIENDAKVGAGITSATVTVKADDALKTRTQIAKAANAHNRTARLRVKGEPVLDKGKPTGDVKIVFTLSPRHKARRGQDKA